MSFTYDTETLITPAMGSKNNYFACCAAVLLLIMLLSWSAINFAFKGNYTIKKIFANISVRLAIGNEIIVRRANRPIHALLPDKFRFLSL